jgi:hypothetical protein
MATIDSKEIVDRIIANNGRYDEDDPLVVMIVQYRNVFGSHPSYGLVYEGEPLDKYKASEYVRDPVCIFIRTLD